MENLADVAISSGSVAERLSSRLIRMIENGDLSPGEKLPTERDLAETANISRASVREALRDLELRGLVSRRPGRGTIVEKSDHSALLSAVFGASNASQHELQEVMDLRAAIEPPIAQRAAARAYAGELTILLSPLERAEEELKSAQPSHQLLARLDVEFHLGLASLAHNSMLAKLMRVSNEWMAPSREKTFQTRLRMAKSVKAHREIFDAVRHKDPVQASEAMSKHICEIHDALGIDPSTS